MGTALSNMDLDRSGSGEIPNAGMNATIKRCIGDEQQPKDQLETQWLGFANSSRVTCTSEAVGNKADAEAAPPIRRIADVHSGRAVGAKVSEELKGTCGGKPIDAPSNLERRR
jgi:hypothetical protein